MHKLSNGTYYSASTNGTYYSTMSNGTYYSTYNKSRSGSRITSRPKQKKLNSNNNSDYLGSTNRRLRESPIKVNEDIPSLDKISSNFSWDNYVSGMC